MSSEQDPEKSRKDQFVARGVSERRSAIDRLQADMQKDRVLSQELDQESYGAVAVQLVKDLRIGHHIKAFASYMLLRSPGLTVGAILGFAVGTRPSGFQGLAPLFSA